MYRGRLPYLLVDLSLLCFTMHGSRLLTLSDPHFGSYCASSSDQTSVIIIFVTSSTSSLHTNQSLRLPTKTHPSSLVSHTPRGLDLKMKLPRSTLQLLRHPERLEDPFKVALRLRRKYRVSPTSLTALPWLRFTWTLIIRIPYSLTYPSQAGD